MSIINNSHGNLSYPPASHKFLYDKDYHNGTVHVAWDNGSGLGAAYREDTIKRI